MEAVLELRTTGDLLPDHRVSERPHPRDPS